MNYARIEFGTLPKVPNMIFMSLIPSKFTSPIGVMATINKNTWESKIGKPINIPINKQQANEFINILKNWLDDQK